MRFLKTSVSLISSSFVLLVANALPVSNTALTPDTFDSTIQNGLWFIEHFSPYCSHCKKFKPTWEQLVAEAETEIPEVKTATVDCIMYGDLCDKNNIKSYPSLVMFEDGKQIDQFTGSRDLPALKSFMKQHIKAAPEPEAGSEAAPEPTPEAPPAKAAPPKQGPKQQLKTDGTVPVSGTALTSATFDSTIQNGLWFIEHFSPYCSHCKHFKPTWEQLVAETATEIPEVKTATVDCIMYGDLCDKNNIKSYPSLVMFEDGKQIDQFTGARDLPALKSFMKQHIKAAPKPEAASEAAPELTPEAPPVKDAPPKQAPEPLPKTDGTIPVSSTALTPDTFDSTIQKGLWFIEHFSPTSRHCKKFEPTWEQLVAATETEMPQVKMGTVDCNVYGDLCDKNKIIGYPQLLMFKDGKQISQFIGARDLPALKTFVKRHIKAGPEPEAASKAAPEPTPEAPPAKATPPKQAPKPRLNTDGQVLALDSDTFEKTLAKGPAFVKFFAPWCGHCKKLAPTWKQLARHLQDKVTIAEVNCDDHSSLCKAQGIQGYPTLVWYAAGDAPSGKSEYNGGRKLDALKAFAEKAASAGVQDLQTTEDLDAVVAKDDVVYLLLYTQDNAHAIDIVREAAVPLLGSPQIYASSDASLLKRFSVASPWALVVIKDHDMKLPASILYGTDATTAADAKLRKWLLTHRLPTSLELTRDTFQSVMNAPQKPLVVLAAAPGTLRAQVLDKLNDIAKKWRVRTDGSGVSHGREIVFAYMDHDEWADWMHSMYRIKKVDTEEAQRPDDLDRVQVVIADHSNLVYYDADREGNPISFTSSKNLFAAVGDAAAGKSEYKHSESFIERIARHINAKMIALEGFVVENIFLTVVLFGFGLFVVFYVMGRLLGNDTQTISQQQTDWARQKGRLD